MTATAVAMCKIIREGMDHYWRVVYSKTDDGLDPTELKWKRDWERDIARMELKFGAAYAEFYRDER